jgi:hypothetical protein
MSFNFQLLIQLVLGDHMDCPLRKFHGSQIETLFAERLHQVGLSHALVSSRWLESNNRPAKAHAQLLTGGNQVVDGAFGNDALLLISRYLTERNFIKRCMLNRDTLART